VDLYPELLAERWSQLDESVRRLHATGDGLSARGVFRVERGSGVFLRAMASVLRLPPAGHGVDVRLAVSRDAQGELWNRRFGERSLESRQRAEAGVLVETLGRFELRFRLEVEGSGLRYESTGAAIRLPGHTVALPRWLSPRVAAFERPAASSATHVGVEVRLPAGFLLLKYEGDVAVEAR
jgi:hypothetical protein